MSLTSNNKTKTFIWRIYDLKKNSDRFSADKKNSDRISGNFSLGRKYKFEDGGFGLGDGQSMCFFFSLILLFQIEKNIFKQDGMTNISVLPNFTTAESSIF